MTDLESTASAVLAASHDTRLRGVAQLLTGRERDAVEVLEAAVQRDPNQAALWNDLGVALHERGRAEDDPESLALALAAVDKALRLAPGMREAAYNRGAVLESLGLSRSAAQARRHYVTIDSASAWASDVRAALDRDRAATKARPQWAIAKAAAIDAALRGDFHAVDEIVRRFPFESRTWVERQLFSQWAASTLAGKPEEATRLLTIGRTVAERLFSLTGEGLPRAAANAIDAALAAGRGATLCEAYVAYDRARGLVAARKPTEVESVMLAAERGFAGAGSPMALVARYYRAAAVFDQRRPDEALALLARNEAELRPEYKSLRGQCLWERSRILGRLGKRYESLQFASAAARQFHQIGELMFAGRNEAEVASRLSWLGQTHEAWRIRRRVFETAARIGSTSLLQEALTAAARDELSLGREDVAASLYAVTEPDLIESPLLRFDTVLWRSYLAARHGDTPSIDLAVEGLRKTMDKVKDPALRNEAEDQMRFAEAMMVREREPQRAVALLNEAIRFRREAGRLARMAEAFLERGRAHRDLANSKAAEADFSAALTALEEQRVEVGAVELRDAFFDVAREACEGLLQIQSLRGAFDEAFGTIERCRARSLLDAVGSAAIPLSRLEISTRLDEETVVASYASAGDATLLMVVTSQGLSAFRLPHDASSIAERAQSLVTAITEHDEGRVRREASALNDILIEPFARQLDSASRLVVVADQSTAAVPFAVLEDSRGSRLIERVGISIAPSASGYAGRSLDRERTTGSNPRVLAIGDPTLDSQLGENLPRLPSAAREAAYVASLWGNAAVYTGEAATKPRFMRDAPSADLIHLATHAVISQRATNPSYLLLSPGGEDDAGVAYLSEIANLRLPRAPLVVLAGCRTGVSARGRGAIRSLAYGFLAAGSRGVVGTLWDIDDDVTMQFSAALHRHLKRRMALSDAVRAAQLEMLRSANPRFRDPGAWASFVSFGS